MDYNTYYMSGLGFKSKNNEDDGNIDLNCPLPYAVSYHTLRKRYRLKILAPAEYTT